MNKEYMKGSILSKAIIFILVIIVVISGASAGIYFLLDKDSDPTDKTEIKNIGEIEGYGITLSERDGDLYKEEFNKLKELLDAKEIDYEEYAKSIAKLFIIDLYDLKSKVNKYDVGGIEEVYESARENFSINVQDTIYKYLEDDTSGSRKQELPKVTSIEVLKIENTKYEIKDESKEYDGYKVELKWTYEYGEGYDTTAEVIIINKDNKLYVVEKN